MYIEHIGTEFGTLQIRRHIRSVEISDVEITNVDCNMISFKFKGLINIISTYQDGIRLCVQQFNLLYHKS